MWVLMAVLMLNGDPVSITNIFGSELKCNGALAALQALQPEEIIGTCIRQ